MPDENLELNMRATLETEDVKKGTKEIENSIKKMEETNKSAHEQIQSQTEKTGGLWTKVFNWSNAVSLVKNGAGMIIGAVQSIGAVLMDFRDAADDQADAVDGVNLQLKNMGIYTDELSEQLQDHAKALEQLTNYSDQAILEGDKMLLTFENLSGDIMPRATEAMLDMSAVMGTDLKSSAQTIGKALQDPINGLGLLSKQGFKFTEQQKESIAMFVKQNDIISAQGVILDSVALAYGGHAKLQVDAVEQAKNAWTSLKEVIGGQVSIFGSKLQPVMDDIFNTFTKIAGAVIKLFPSKAIKEANEYADAAKNQKTEFDLLSITYTRLSANQNKTKEETKVYKDTIAELKKQYPEFLEKIDMEKEGYNGVATALAKINEHLMKKMLFAVKEKEMAKEQQRIIDAETKKYDATLNYNKALSEQQVLINKLSKKKETWENGETIKDSEGNITGFRKYGEKDYRADPTMVYRDGEYLKKRLTVEDEASLAVAKRRLKNIKEEFKKEVEGYDAEKADATNQIIKIDEKYNTIAGVTKESLEEAEKGKDKNVNGKGTETSDIKFDPSKTLEQQIQDVKNKAEIEKIAADEYQKQIIDINKNRDIAILTEEMKLKKEIEKIKNDYESTDDANKKKKLEKQLIDAQEATQKKVYSLNYNAATEIDAIKSTQRANEALAEGKYEEPQGIYNTYKDEQLTQELPGISSDILRAEKRKEQAIWEEHYNMLGKMEEGHLSYREIAKSKLEASEKKRLEKIKMSMDMEKSFHLDKMRFELMTKSTTTGLADKLISGEIKSGKQMKELMKTNMKAFLVDSGQRHAHKALEEGAEAISRFAAQDYPGATAHGIAAAEHAAVAAAAGVAANKIKTPSSTNNNNQNSNLPGSAVSAEKKKELIINTDNQAIIRMLIPEFAQALDDGYSISKK